MPRRKGRSCLSPVLLGIGVASILLLAVGYAVPLAAESGFGPPDPTLLPWEKLRIGAQLLVFSSELTMAPDVNGSEQLFVIEAGEDAYSVSNRLEQAKLISDARAFRLYLTWTGMDAFIQSGTFRLSPALPAMTIAGMIQSTTMTEVIFNVLAGWRLEEVAASLATSGLTISEEQFISSATNPNGRWAFIPVGSTVEGFLYPDSYILPRTSTSDHLVETLINGFLAHLPSDYSSSYDAHGLTLYQGVILASIVEREAVVDDEMAQIASVFHNRLAIGMMLQSDPTVQYSLGYNEMLSSWWKTPLSAEDMEFDSPYNTYLYAGLPPTPIANPGLSALAAVAYPADSPYYYFQARCDASGLHNFAITLEEHVANNCP